MQMNVQKPYTDPTAAGKNGDDNHTNRPNAQEKEPNALTSIPNNQQSWVYPTALDRRQGKETQKEMTKPEQ